MRIFFSALALCCFLTGAASAETPQPIKVVASFTILSDIATEVGGGDFDVITLIGPNGNPHSYEPTPQDIKELAGAKLLLINGLGFEGWLSRLISVSNFKGRVIIASQDIKPLELSGAGTQKTLTDPHAWQNLANGASYARTISDGFVKAAPDDALNIRLRTNAYVDRLESLDRQIRENVKEIPLAKRRIMLTHNGFRYFGAAYGVDIYAPVGALNEAEPSAQAVAKLIGQMKDLGIKTIFPENMSSPRFAEQLAKEGGIKVGETLYSDSLSDKTGPAPSYISMMESNLPKLLKAMQENSPR